MSKYELREILIQHTKTYPLMQPTDAVKLIYQNEFGGGHLISDKEACFRYLKHEFSQTEQKKAPLFEEIGNGIVRVNLCALDANRISLDELFTWFCISSEMVCGDIAGFREKLAVLRDITEETAFGFGTDELDQYLTKYEEAGFPPVSHSDAYRNAYSPAYRIVLKKLFQEKVS